MAVTETLGDRVRRVRLAKGYTQRDVVVQMHLRGHSTWDEDTVADIEHGRRKMFRPKELISLARILGLAISALLGVPDIDP